MARASEQQRPVRRVRTIGDIVLVAGIVLTVFVGLGSLSWPLGDDQAMFSWIGGIILDGGVPYRDGWDIKGPLTHYLYAFALAVFGRHAMSIRVLDMFTVLSCCWFVREASLRLNGGNAFGASLAAIFVALAYYSGGFFNTALPDWWSGILALVGVLLLLDPPWQPIKTMAAIGTLIGLAALLKPTSLLFALVPVLCPSGVPGGKRRYIKLLVSCVLPLALTIALALLVLRHLSGGLEDFFDVLYFLHTSYVPAGQYSLFEQLTQAPQALFTMGVLIPYLLVPFGVAFMLRSDKRREARIIIVWLATSLVIVMAQGRYWPGHWGPSLIAVAVTLSVSFSRLRQPWRTPGRADSRAKILSLLVYLSALAPTAELALAETYTWPSYALGWQTKRQYFAYIGPWISTVADVSEYIELHSTPGDSLLTWGNDIVFNVLADRKAPTRFGIAFPLVTRGPLEKKYRQIFLNETLSDPPLYIIIDCLAPWFLSDQSGPELLKGFPEFDTFVHAQYRQVGTYGQYQLWKRNRPQPATADVPSARQAATRQTASETTEQSGALH